MVRPSGFHAPLVPCFALAVALCVAGSASAAPAVPRAAGDADGLLAPRDVTAGAAPRVLPGGVRVPTPAGPPAAAPGLEAARAGVRLVGAGSASVQFEVAVPEPDVRALEGGRGFQSLTLDGYDLRGEVGGPALPRREVFVAVPPTGAVRVRAIGLDAARRGPLRLAPLPAAGAGASEAVRYDALPEAYARGSDAAPERARLLGVSWMRGQRVAEIEILPVSYVPATGVTNVYARIAVTVEFSGAAVSGPPAAEPTRPDPFEGVYRSVLVNYEQGRAWRRPLEGGRAARPAGVQGVVTVPDTSVFAGRTWAKIVISKTGFYRVNFASLALLPEFAGTTGTKLDSLRMFTWPGFPVLPEASYCDSCDFREVAISVIDGASGDGEFDDSDDYLEFFAMGPSDWADLYDPARPDTVFINNPYETNSYYYLTIATASLPVGGVPRRYGNRSGQILNGAAATPATFEARQHFEKDLEYFPDATTRNNFDVVNTLFWEKWFWRSFTGSPGFSPTFDLPNLDPSLPARVRTSVWGISTSAPCATANHAARVSVNGGPATLRYWGPTSSPPTNTGHIFDDSLAAGALMEAGNTLAVDAAPLPCPTISQRVALAWFDVFYPQRYAAIDDALTFDGPRSPGDYIYRVTGFTVSTPPRVIDVTDAYGPVEITNLEYADAGNGTWTLRFESVEPGRRRYRIIQPADVIDLTSTSLRSALATSTENLRSPSLGADYVVIYYDPFKPAADSLLAWRESHLPLVGGTAPYLTMGVPISALFDQFSGGRTDPAAIRNFLRAAATNWSRVPAFVTLLGDASYDFKDYLGRARSGDPGSLLPSYENGFDTNPSVRRQYSTDDWLLNVDDATRIIPDFYGGRIPAGDLAAANTYVRKKLLAYERSGVYGDFRNRFMLIADDDKQGSNPDNLQWTHVHQTAQLDENFTPVHIDRQYVYLHKYPDGPGSTKPGAKADIINGIDEGVAVVNFVGHGSPFKMADESVFLDTDAGALTNADRLAVFIAASCDIGKFNDPTVPSLGERLVLGGNGGAVGVISATELALSSQNSQLNQTVYSGIFNRGAGGPYEEGLAQALLAAKLGSSTTQKYQLMGDSGLRLNLPRLWAEMTLWDSAGTTPETEITRGRTLMVRGQMYDYPGGSPLAYDGVASLLIEDSAPYEQTPPCTFDPNCFRYYYYYTAGPVFRGDVAVRGGVFESRFIVPMESRLGGHGRLRAYFHDASNGGTAVSIDGVGGERMPVATGSAPAGDTEGPLITLSFPGGATTVKPDATLTIGLADPSGILTTGHTLQNGIIVTVDDNTTARVDVTDSFRYAADSYQSGTATFQLPNLDPGSHSIRVSAADNLAAGLDAAAHRASAVLSFDVQTQPRLRIARAYLFPNPIRSGGAGSGGQFVVDVPGDSVNVLIRIYTVSGRQVKALRAYGGLGQVQLPWDGRDSEGAELANGVYLFKVHVNPRDELGESDASRKATAEGRVVVVGH